MKITKEQLKQIIKEELEAVIEYNEPTPNRGIPKIKRYGEYQGILEKEFADFQPDVTAERYFDYSDIDALENFYNDMLDHQDGGVVSSFIEFVGQVIRSLGG